jgi:NADH-quinone oxidoreductase subunit E
MQVEQARDRYPHPRSAILPALWAVQHQFGYLPKEGMAEVAAILGLAPSEVQAVSTFYSMFFAKPPGRHHLLICVNVACALRGADETAAYLERRLGCPSGSTTADGAFTWASTIECLGGCGGAPMMQIDHRFHENLTPERIDTILERVAAEPGEAGHGRAGEGRPRADARPNAPTAETPPPAEAEGPPSASQADTGGPAAAPPEHDSPEGGPRRGQPRRRPGRRPRGTSQ